MPIDISNKLLKIEAMRGFAALYVVLHHTVKFEYLFLGIDLGELFRFGQEAVILFFLLSGFVINLSFKKSNNKTFKTYFYKRFFRIYIPLSAVFTIGFITESYNQNAWQFPSISQFSLNLLMLQDWAFAKPNVITEPLFNNTPLWSLSYEWWFYMLYFPLAKYIPNFKAQSLIVYLIAITSAITYLYYPNFINRLLMYLAIWWTGVWLSECLIESRPINLRNIILSILSLGAVTLVLAYGVYVHRSQGGALLLGAHPLLEVRHFLFAIWVVIAALVWKNFQWLGFSLVFGKFTILAPISYAIYIAHYHVMTSATYLDFIESTYIQWLAYFLVLIVVSWFLERKLYIWFVNTTFYKSGVNAPR